MPSAFERLDRSIQQVLWDKEWEEIRGFQAEAIHAWFDSECDIILSANTASGKTEAAFLPLLSSIVRDGLAGSIQALYVGPLKALINDQFRRLEELCARTNIPVHRWHGDVSQDKKSALLKSPSGILLITPESLESLLMRKGREVSRIFHDLRATVIDEMHSFLATERGRQLATLLERIESHRHGCKRARRIGLSATLGDDDYASQWLAGSSGSRPLIIRSSTSQAIELIVRSFTASSSEIQDKNGEQGEEDSDEGKTVSLGGSLVDVAEFVFSAFNGRTNLVFCNRKVDAEILADYLVKISHRRKAPNEFVVHHGSLSKALREDVEKSLQSKSPCTALCSSTLELGIDVGSVYGVGQVGPPHTVNSFRQRLGRSGRREGEPSRMWVLLPIQDNSEEDDPTELVYPEILQSIAIVNLMLSRWVEPPDRNEFDLSTLAQQVLSVIVERGGIEAHSAYQLICGVPSFSIIDPSTFAQALRDLASHDLIEQTSKGDLILGLIGEKITSHYDFFAAFEVNDQFRVLDRNRHIGDIDAALTPNDQGSHLLLGGMRWEIVDIDFDRLQVFVRKAARKQMVVWTGEAGFIHANVRQAMRQTLEGEDVPSWIDKPSADALATARRFAKNTGLLQSDWLEWNGTWWLFPWTGSREHHALELVFLSQGIEVRNHGGLALEFPKDCSPDRTTEIFMAFLQSPPEPHLLVLRAFGERIPPCGKHGGYFSPPLRAKAYAARCLDVEGAVSCASRFMECKSEKEIEVRD